MGNNMVVVRKDGAPPLMHDGIKSNKASVIIDVASYTSLKLAVVSPYRSQE